MTSRTGTRETRSRAILGLLAVSVCIGSAGCSIADRRRVVDVEVQSGKDDLRVTMEQARLRMRSMVGPMCGQVEECADAIMAGATDDRVKLAALGWKMQAVPALREALLRTDPGTAALDTTVLCFQMSDYFETGAGRQALGPAGADAAAATCQRMADEFVEVVASSMISRDVSKGRAFARQWATDHPIRRSIADRESALARSYELEFTGESTARQFLADVATTVNDVNRKLDVYSDQLFRQARWEAERMRLELVRDLRAAEVVPMIERLAKSTEETRAAVDRLVTAVQSIQGSLGIAQDAPQLFASERETAVNAMRDEMKRTMQVVHDERVAALEQLAKERGIALDSFREIVAEQRQQITGDVDQISTSKIDYAMQRVTRLVVITMSAAAVAFLLVGLLLVRWLAAGRRGRHAAS